MLSVKVWQKIYNGLEKSCGGEIPLDRISTLTDEQIIRGVGTSDAMTTH